MRQRQETVTVTLHWLAGGAEQAANIVCEDGPPAELIPLLLRGCGLPSADRDGRPRPYLLRLDSADGRALHPSDPVGRQGVRSGARLWLVEGGVRAPLRCVLRLPDGSELLVPRQGVSLTRAWLLQALALLNPEGHRLELARVERRESAYRAVSNRPHCALAPLAGGFAVRTDRQDVLTLLNGARLATGAPAQLQGGDRLTLGENGLTLAVALLGEC
jgi:hypothetical protein